jgi:hypothetical protein
MGKEGIKKKLRAVHARRDSLEETASVLPHTGRWVCRLVGVEEKTRALALSERTLKGSNLRTVEP